MTDALLFAYLRRKKREWTNAREAGLSQAEVDELNAVLHEMRNPAPLHPVPAKQDDPLTVNVAMEIISHEAIVQEAYKDSVGVWTWGIGVTNASGHLVHPRYKDNPQPIERCLEVFIWLLRERYMPAVQKAFAGKTLSEAQFAAALSFHYNTGAIAKASWVKQWRDGDEGAAHRSFMLWNKPPEILPRRNRERDLFFDGRWSNDCTALVIPVRKPSYTPDFARSERIDVLEILKGLLA